MSTLKPNKNIVQEISHQVVLTDLARETMEWLINQAVIQDRQDVHTSLVAAVEGIKITKKVMHDHEYIVAKTPEEIKRDTLTIINSIFKE